MWISPRLGTLLSHHSFSGNSTIFHEFNPVICIRRSRRFVLLPTCRFGGAWPALGKEWWRCENLESDETPQIRGVVGGSSVANYAATVYQKISFRQVTDHIVVMGVTWVGRSQTGDSYDEWGTSPLQLKTCSCWWTSLLWHNDVNIASLGRLLLDLQVLYCTIPQPCRARDEWLRGETRRNYKYRPRPAIPGGKQGDLHTVHFHHHGIHTYCTTFRIRAYSSGGSMAAANFTVDECQWRIYK